MTFGPFYKTELFLGAGTGYHSNDARGVTAIEVPGDPATPQGTMPFLVRSLGAEIGVRTKMIPNLDSSISLFYLHQDLELFFDGDTGTTVPGPPSLRTGIEITNKYRLGSWVSVDADLALSRARFIGFDLAQEQPFQSLAGFPQAQIGNSPGNFVPEAPWMVASAGITLGEKTGWFSSLRWRYISSRPLTEDGVFQSPPVNTINGDVGYRFANGWRVQFDALNLLNSTSYNASYAYGALLTTDSLFAKCFPTPKIPVAVCQNGLWTIRFTLNTFGSSGSHSPDRSIPSTFPEWPRSSGGQFPRSCPHRQITIGPDSISAVMANSVRRLPTGAPSTLQRGAQPLPSTATCLNGTAASSWASTT